jgi:hypothetical protein
MMTIHVRSLVIGAPALAGAAALWAPTARSQVSAMPSWVPIGVSASGNGSTAWFHEPSSRQALACHAVPAAGGGVASVQCAVAKLP